jgi:phenylalanine ammonia-lyase
MDSNTSNDRSSRHLLQVASVLQAYKSSNGQINLNGKSLSISDIHSVFTNKFVSASMSEEAMEAVKNSYEFLKLKVSEGACVYGVNTGFGGSADVRYKKEAAVQIGGVTHLKVGFGETFPIALTKAAMLVRANCIGLGYSGVQSSVLDLLVEVLNKNIIPYSPKRGTVSASGDLMPLIYIAALLEGRPNCLVNDNGEDKDAPVALSQAGLSPVAFQGKDVLGVVNAASVAATLGADVLYRGNLGIVLTQALVAMTVEALEGRLESFKPVIHEQCLPHIGQQEVARNITNFLSGTKFAITVLEMDRGFRDGELKQDRYGLRSSPQWLGPTLETALESMRRIKIELNSANDNPIVDPRTKAILHCSNFQGNSSTVAMDQFRQSMQICGKLLFALMSEIMDYKINNDLSPNLCGGDLNVDMGFKGTETAMASYTSELDYLTNPLSNHVLSAELRNQGVNSLALISARMSETALEIFLMQITNILLSLCQAVELRWIKSRVVAIVEELVSGYTSAGMAVLFKLVPWFRFFCSPEDAVDMMLKDVPGPKNAVGQNNVLVDELSSKMNRIRDALTAGKYVQEIANEMGQGKLYLNHVS